MKRLDFWALMVLKDDWILSAIEGVRVFAGWFDWSLRRFARETRCLLARLQTQHALYVVLNGPSVQQQDLSVLKSRDLVFVNRGFLHPLYQELHPKFHIFVDSKMIHGIWSPAWLEQIHEMVPDITFVLPIKWAKHPYFQEYIAKGFNFIWFPNKGGLRGIGVGGRAFELGFMLNYKEIFFTGFEASGFAQDLLKQASHFYGFVDDKELQTPTDIMRGYYMNARQMRELMLIAQIAKKKGVRMVNMTEGGLLGMFERKNIKEINAP